MNWWIGFAVIILILSEVPVIGKYLKLFNTMVHETGHAVGAIITGGRVRKIELFSNTGGLATTLHGNKLSQIFTTFVGYPFASVASVLGIWALKNHGYTVVGVVIFCLLLVNTLLWVRNIIGWLWVTATLGLFVGAYYLNENVFEHVVIAVVIMIWLHSTSSAFHIATLSVTRPSDAGDASILARATFIPAIFWGTVFVVFALLCFVQGGFLWLDKGWLWDILRAYSK